MMVPDYNVQHDGKKYNENTMKSMYTYTGYYMTNG